MAAEAPVVLIEDDTCVVALFIVVKDAMKLGMAVSLERRSVVKLCLWTARTF